MPKKSQSHKSAKLVTYKASKTFYSGMIIERFKRQNGLPPRTLDWESEHFLWRYLGGRKYI